MEYEDYKQLSEDIKAIEKIVSHALGAMTLATIPLKEGRSLTKSLKHLTKMKHILDRQLHFEHAPPEPWSSHDLFF